MNFASFYLNCSTKFAENLMKEKITDLYIFDIMRFTAILCLWIALIFFSCRQDEKGMKPLDLEPYGLAMTIMAPDSASVEVKEYPFTRDITIRKGDDFHIQLFELPSNGNRLPLEKKRQMTAIKKDPAFVEIIEDFEDGFIYSKQQDSLKVDYDFRCFRYLGDKELIFQTGVLSAFSLEDVRQMVASIRENP